MDETMTRERMLKIQRDPKRPVRAVLRSYLQTKDGIERFADHLVAIAERQGRKFAAAGGDVRHGWWPALAPLTKPERAAVRAALAAQKAA